MAKINCWEFKKCGREPGGKNSIELGLCLASIDTDYNGINNGKNAGRLCWAVTGTLCGSVVQGTFAEKRLSCMTCEFFKKVKEEEDPDKFVLLKPGQVYKKINK
ncbi:MAG: hypothetical protein HY934_04290 [Candidatus Firestonebacteria bacterium]|nr:hypothetical protein [Candidatus Firestonebacteria bacterium]